MIYDEVTDQYLDKEKKVDTFVSQQKNNKNPKMLWDTTST